MRTYEVFVQIKASNDEGAEKAIKDLEGLLAKSGGSIVSKDIKGAHKLATPIDKNRDAIQAVLIIQANPSSLSEFRKQASLLDSILRLATFSVEEARA